MPTYPNPGLEAELAYRRELLQQIGRGTRTRRNPWTTRWSRAAWPTSSPCPATPWPTSGGWPRSRS